MRCIVSQRVVPRTHSVGLAFGAVLLSLSALARAGSDVDIPRLQAGAERGSIKEEVELGAAYFAGRGVAQDEKQAAYWYEKAANAGDPWAQMQIGYFYQAGIGVARDPAQGVKWFQRAAASGLVSAKVNLGVAYLRGEAVRKDTELAEQMFRQAFAQGSGSAAYFLGEMYAEGIGVQRDEAAGERWFEAGAKLHDARAEFQLANLLWLRQKDPNETRRAVKLLRQSADGGLVQAKHQLGVLLVKRPELAASPQEASSLLKEAAEAGEWRSSVALGLLSRDGLAGVPADSKAAYYHYQLAALQGGDEGFRVVANDLEKLSAKLGAEQTAALDKDAAVWQAHHHLALMFVDKDGGKRREAPVYGLARPVEGLSSWRLIPTDQLLMPDPIRRSSTR